jgi:hypothetical protein
MEPRKVCIVEKALKGRSIAYRTKKHVTTVRVSMLFFRVDVYVYTNISEHTASDFKAVRTAYDVLQYLSIKTRDISHIRCVILFVRVM